MIAFITDTFEIIIERQFFERLSLHDIKMIEFSGSPCTANLITTRWIYRNVQDATGFSNAVAGYDGIAQRASNPINWNQQHRQLAYRVNALRSTKLPGAIGRSCAEADSRRQLSGKCHRSSRSLSPSRANCNPRKFQAIRILTREELVSSAKIALPDGFYNNISKLASPVVPV